MIEVIKTTFMLRRGQSEVWLRNNPVLAAGEPGYELDTHKIKIGDGVNSWIDLPYIGEHNIVNCSTHFEFPVIGNENYIYKASEEALLYQWDSKQLIYVSLGAADVSEEIDYIDCGGAEGHQGDDVVHINGGNANGID